MKLIASMWTIAIALCLLGAASADELATSGDAKSLGFSAARLARIAPWYQARFDSFSPSDGLVPQQLPCFANEPFDLLIFMMRVNWTALGSHTGAERRR